MDIENRHGEDIRRFRLGRASRIEGAAIACAALMLSGCSDVDDGPRRQHAPNPPSVGIIDTPREGQNVAPYTIVTGWVIDEARVKVVRIYLDDQLVASVPPNVPRKDVAQRYPALAISNAHSGFGTEVDFGDRNGYCTIRVEALDGAGALTRFAAVTVNVRGHGSIR
jgi:hypothetical protein